MQVQATVPRCESLSTEAVDAKATTIHKWAAIHLAIYLGRCFGWHRHPQRTHRFKSATLDAHQNGSSIR